VNVRARSSVVGLVVGLGVAAAIAFGLERAGRPLRAGFAAALEGLGSTAAEGDPAEPREVFEEGEIERAYAVPTGSPTALACDDARLVTAQALGSLAAPVPAVNAAKFADATADWLDPHGMWAVAQDSPVGEAIRREAQHLLDELQAPVASGPCAAARRVGAEMAAWSRELRALFDEGAKKGLARAPAGAREVTAFGGATPPPPASAPEPRRPGAEREARWKLARATPFEDGAVTRSGRDLARDLGEQAGALRAAYGPALDPYVEAARDRAAPELDAEAWSKVVVAAALRAFVPQLDAHGAWAPLDEELSIYDLSIEQNPPERLWTEMTRTALGVRIDRGALSPLADGDVVLRIQDVPLAGMSVEQADQASVVSAARGPVTHVTVLRVDHAEPLELALASASAPSAKPSQAAPAAPDDVAPEAPGDRSPGTPELPVEAVRYGDGQVGVVTIADVPDDLGARMSVALERARRPGGLRGLVLDLRANGGGSTDGAIAAIGRFLPGAPLFPMRRRDGAIEVERAPEVPTELRYTGPLAVLVDGDSASAAEMIAGGLGSYRRAVVIGDRTYGKGCAQEYLDDDAHAGVLRLTTLLFALPDGSPVQKTGIQPMVQLSLPATPEREASMSRALGPWRGPDVRDASMVRDTPWPNHGGRVGPCRDETVCRALRTLGASPAAAR
jgi:carboxyl-terminal processing protease